MDIYFIRITDNRFGNNFSFTIECAYKTRERAQEAADWMMKERGENYKTEVVKGYLLS